MKKAATFFLTLAFAASMLAGCAQQSGGGATREQGRRLRVVTTIFPEYDWVRQILRDKREDWDVTMLLDNGADLHSYQPTAEDMVRIADCDLFVYVGGESDAWVEDALQQAPNPDRRVINLLDVLGGAAKTEEARPGMQDEAGHRHGYTRFADSDVKDRSLADWSGSWQSVYPFLQDGTLDEVMARKAENGHQTAEEYRRYYETGYRTEVERITIDGEAGTMEFVKNGVSSKANYQYQGYQIYDYASGERGVRYFFAATSGDESAPRCVQFSDHGIEPGKAEHFHIYTGNDGFDALSQEMEHWPTYYPAGMTGREVAEEMLEHEEKEYDEHVWLSVKNAQLLCAHIAEVIGELDPENREAYQEHAAAYLEQLAALDRDYEKTVQQAVRKTILFADRFPFRYLVDDYGLHYYAAFSGCSAETEASFETVSFLAGKTDELALPCVLTIEGKQHRIAETIVQNTQEKTQKILTMDSMQGVTAGEVEKGMTYLSVMEQNLRVLQEALQ